MRQKDSFTDKVQPELADLPLTNEQAQENTAGSGNVAFIGPPATTKIGGGGIDILIANTGERY